jgi:hypothetical protein
MGEKPNNDEVVAETKMDTSLDDKKRGGCKL